MNFKAFLTVITLFFIIMIVMLRSQEIAHKKELNNLKQHYIESEQKQSDQIEALQILLTRLKVEYCEKHMSNSIKQFQTHTIWTDNSDKEDLK